MVDSVSKQNNTQSSHSSDKTAHTSRAGNTSLSNAIGSSTSSLTARVSGADAVRLGSGNSVTAQQTLRWAQPQSAVQSGGQPVGPGQLSQVQQARAVPAAGGANAPTPPNAATLAQLANDVYRDSATPPAGFRTASQADLNRMGLRQSDLEPVNSAFRARVYATGAGNQTQYVVAFRGSTSDARDWVSNGQQAAGLPSDHYSRALAVGRALARNDDVPVTITGHSLGGGLASAAAVASGQDATTFNAAGLSQNTINQANAIRSGEGASGVANVSAIYVRGEILSALQDGGDRMLGGAIGRLAGGALGGPLGGAAGGLFGQTFTDAPSAYGNRIQIDAVRPANMAWYQDFPVLTAFNRHGMDYVLSSMGVR